MNCADATTEGRHANRGQQTWVLGFGPTGDGAGVHLSSAPGRGVHPEGLFAGGLALLLCLFVATVAGAVHGDGGEIQVRLEPGPAMDGATPAAVSSDQAALLLPAGRSQESVVRARFTLPAAGADSPRWILWVGRGAVDSLHLQRDDWASVRRDFFAPGDDEGVLPSGFHFPLPDSWQGEVEVDLHATGSQREALRVRVLPGGAVLRIGQLGAAASAAVYASLFTLALMTLALFAASRDRVFLLFFASTTLALLLLAADNGHLYQMPVFGLFATWRGQGIWALSLLFMAVVLQLVQRYAGTAGALPQLAAVADRVGIVLCSMAAVCLLRLGFTDVWLPVAGSVAAFVAAAVLLAVLADAGRRRLQMAWPLTLLAILAIAAVITTELLARGRWMDPVWMRYGCQLLLAAGAAVLAVGLVSRISEYRNQRDRDRLARADSERRMRREAARADLNSALQAKLRTLPSGDVEWAAFRLLLDHLVPQVPVQFATVIALGFHGQDISVVVPQAHKQAVDELVSRRLLVLKRSAANGIPLQQPVTLPSEQGVVAMEALLPLSIRAPAWGALLLHRTGGDGFSTEELALAGEFMRVTLLNIEQATAAIALRRSAELDALTGAFNRRTIDQWLVRGFAEADRDGQPASVLFVDMDHFKGINDRLGHACGDHCLRQVATTLRGTLADGDLLGRYGGEEFIAVLPGRGGAASRVIAEQMRAAVERLQVDWEGQPVRLTVSVGVATRLQDETAPATVDRADKALYAAKRAGRNCVQVAPAVFS